MDKISIEEMALGYCKDRTIVVAQMRQQAKELEAKAEGIKRQADDLEKLVADCLLEIEQRKIKD